MCFCKKGPWSKKLKKESDLVSGRPGKSREGPGTGQDLETLKVPWSCGPGTKEVQKSRDFFLKVLGLPGPFFPLASHAPFCKLAYFQHFLVCSESEKAFLKQEMTFYNRKRMF